jgi:glycosyltransferase involved in cell wall biosynthesis
MKIAAFLQDLEGGGAERVAVLLLNELAGRHDVALVLARRAGPYLADLDPRIRLHDLGNRRTLASVVPLAAWLRRNRPDVLISHLTHVNVAATMAVKLSRAGVRLIAVEHNQMRRNYQLLTARSVKLAYRLARVLYPRADCVVSVSDGVAASVREFTGLDGANFETIANPVVTPRLHALAAEAPNHPWLRDKPAPVLLGCGRLVEQKDFATLLRAFRLVRDRRPARLLILGEGEKRPELEALVAELGLTGDVALPGFDSNPFAAMRAADAFVLSSRWEGLPTVLIEALAAGAAVASTDCPSGPREVLKDGALGALAPIADPPALAAAIEQALDHPPSAEARRARAGDYTVARAAADYEALAEALTAGKKPSTRRS